jgi:hypothetical protein
MAKHNGHRSWNAWNVSLWINNDEGLYNIARECVGNARNRGKSMDDAAESILATFRDMCITKTPDGGRYNKTTIREAIRGY